MQMVIRAIVLVFALTATASLIAQSPQPAASPATAPAAASAAAPALTADGVVAKYIEAIGGKQAIGQVKSLSMETSVQVMGNDAPGSTEVLDGVGYRNETQFNDSKIIQVYTPKGGWQVNPMAGMTDPTPLGKDQYNAGKDEIYVGGQLYNYAALGYKIELVGNDPDTYKVKLTTKDNLESTYVIDAATFLVRSAIRKGKMQDQDVDITTTYTDYQKADGGYLIPRSIGVDFGGQFQITIAVKKVEINPTIDPAIFEMPKAAPAEAAPATPKS